LAGGFCAGRAADERRAWARSQAEDHRRVDAQKIARDERDHQRADADAAAPDAPAATSSVLDVLTRVLLVQTHAHFSQ
jgi:predicted Fe-S protein YdhL (DUF1289 family)